MRPRPNRPATDTRQHVLQAALQCFAHAGYAATSVQDVVDRARVSKPTLYYHFGDKAGLYRALVESALDRRFALMQEAARVGGTLREKLVEIVAALFEFCAQNRELVRIAFATAFAAPGEVPPECGHREKGRRNYEFVRRMIAQAQARGELDRRFDSEQLAFGIYGQLTTYMMVHLLWPECRLDRAAARQVVELFLTGAAPRPAAAARRHPTRKGRT